MDALVVLPLKRYKDALENFRDHQKAAYHQEALEKSQEFPSLCARGTTVVQLANSTLASRIACNRKILRGVIESVLLCGCRVILLFVVTEMTSWLI